MKKATVELFTKIFSVLAPPPDMTISQWADEYRRLSSESSAEPGRWRTSKAPYQREIMDAVCDMRVQKVVIMSAAQIGKTDALILNPIGYYMHYDPSPIMVMQPTVAKIGIENYSLTAYDGAESATAPAGRPETSGGSNNTGGAGSPADGKGTGKMKASEFIKRLQDVVDNHATLYVMGCFGAPLTGANVSRYCANHSYNQQAARTAMIKAAANKNPPVFGFDCVNLIKGVLWGWTGDASRTYGGAIYKANGVPDTSADGMAARFVNPSTDFSGIIPGEAVWLSGHIGVYIGGGKVIECTPAFKNCVQVTACLNTGAISGMNGRKWTKHGRLPYINYDTTAETTAGSATAPAGWPGTSGGSSNTTATLAFSVGDVVRFTGAKHYASANAATGPACKPGTARVIGTYKGKHPYQLKAEPGGGSTVYGWVDAADVQAVGGNSAGSGTAAPKMCVGARVQYSGPLYRDSNGNGQGKTVNGAFTVKYYYPGRKCGVHIDGLGWVPESACSVIG